MTIPGLSRVSRNATKRRSRLPFHWRAADVVENGLGALSGQDATFARASAGGLVLDRNGRLVGPHANVLPRYSMYDPDGGGTRDTPALMVELERTNEILRSEEFNDASWTKSATVTANDAVAPDGAKTADKVDDTSGGSTHTAEQAITVANDGARWAASVYVKQRTGAPVMIFRLAFSGGTALDYRVALNPDDGTTTASGSPDTPDRVGAIREGDYWRLYLVGQNNASGNTSLNCQIAPAGRANTSSTAFDSSQTGHQHLWGVQIEEGRWPTSYQKTAGSTVTRSAETVYWEYLPDPAALTIYLKFVELGAFNTPGLGILHIGSATAGTDPRLAITVGGGQTYSFSHDNGTTAPSASLAAAPSYGDEVELRCVLYADGHVRIGQSIGGAAEATATDATTAALGSAWAGQRLYLGSRGSSNIGHTAFIECKVAFGERTMAQMRSAF